MNALKHLRHAFLLVVGFVYLSAGSQSIRAAKMDSCDEVCGPTTDCYEPCNGDGFNEPINNHCGTHAGGASTGQCTGECNDGYCNGPNGEDIYSCPEDCSVCGDGYCAVGYEACGDYSSGCAADCDYCYQVDHGLYQNQQMLFGDSIVSENGEWELAFVHDVADSPHKACLGIRPSNSPYFSHGSICIDDGQTTVPFGDVVRVWLTNDGNLLLLDEQWRVAWESATYVHYNAWLDLTDDGYMVIYSTSNQELWRYPNY